MTDEIETFSIKTAIEEIKKIEAYKDAKEKGEEHEIELSDSRFDTFTIAYDEISKIDWDKINVSAFVGGLYSQVEKYEEESYKELYGNFDDYEDEYLGEITGLYWG